jgi:hypothetical protein
MKSDAQPGAMDQRGYPHELEHRRELAKGHREQEYTELVDDTGFILEHRAERLKEWTVRYTTACAQDFLQRQRARSGTVLSPCTGGFPTSRSTSSPSG